MTQITRKTRAKHIQSTADPGWYLRDYRRGQAATISDTRRIASLGERFISESEGALKTVNTNNPQLSPHPLIISSA